MQPALVYIQPFNTTTNARVDVRVADGGSAAVYATGGNWWQPALTGRPELSSELFSLNLDGQVLPARVRLEIKPKLISTIGNPAKIYWDGAPIVIYSSGVIEGPTAIPDFKGNVIDVAYDKETGRLSITAEVSTAKIDTNLLIGAFNGGGGGGGDAAMRGVLYPAGFGAVKNIEPIWFDLTRNIGMIDGYGNTLSIDFLGEGRSSFGASVGDYATYAALAAAIDAKVIPPGRWGTCIAQGMVGLGAPPTGTITVDASFGYNRSGAMMLRILRTHAGIADADIDLAAFGALDVAVNRAVHYWTADQRNIKDLLQAICRGANATPLLSPQGKITVTRAVASAPALTLDRTGGGSPSVLNWKTANPPQPFYKLQARGARPALVMTYDQINYVDDIIDMGLYDPTATYRQGNLVWLPDSSQWLYVNPTPASGHAPPAPATSDAYWEQTRPPSTAADFNYGDGTPIEALKPADPGASADRVLTILSASPTFKKVGNTIKSNNFWETFYSKEVVKSGARLSFTVDATNMLAIIGFANNPPNGAGDPFGYSAAVAGDEFRGLYFRDSGNGIWSVTTGNPVVAMVSTYVAGDSFVLEHDNINCYVFKNGAPLTSFAMPTNKSWLMRGQIATGSLSAVLFGASSDNNFANAGGPTRPSDNATSDVVLTAVAGQSANMKIVGNTLQNLIAADEYNATAYAEPRAAPVYVECILTSGYNMLSLDDDATSYLFADQVVMVQFLPGTSSATTPAAIYFGGVAPSFTLVQNDGLGVAVAGDRAWLLFDGNTLWFGFRGTMWKAAAPSALKALNRIFPKVTAFSATSPGRVITGIRAGAASDNRIYNSFGVPLPDNRVDNNALIINADGTLTNSGGGSVTPGGLGLSPVTLTTIGSFTVVRGNTTWKQGGTHAAIEGAALGAPQSGPCYASCSIIDALNGGGWVTYLALDPSPSTFALASQKYYAVYTCTGPGAGTVFLVANGVSAGPFAVSGLTNASRIILLRDGLKVRLFIDGTQYAAATDDGTVKLYPKFIDYHRNGADRLGGVDPLPGYARVNIVYGPVSDNRVYDPSGNVLPGTGYMNVSISLNADGTINNAGGGVVTPTGLGLSPAALTTIGSGTTIRGNASWKSSGTHGAYEGGVVGTPQAGPCFVSSSIINAAGGGGWATINALDTSQSTFGATQKYLASLTGTSAGSGNVSLAVNGTVVDSNTVSGLTAASRMLLLRDGVKVRLLVDGTQYCSAPDDGTDRLYPKFIDYHRNSATFIGGSDPLAGYARADMQYGAVSVSAAPGATNDVTLTAISNVTVQGNTINGTGAAGYTSCAWAPARKAPVYIEMDIKASAWNILALDDDSTTTNVTDQKVAVQYHSSSGIFTIEFGPSNQYNITGSGAGTPGFTGKLTLAFDGVNIVATLGGQSLTLLAPAGWGPNTVVYPKAYAYSGGLYTGVRVGNWADVTALQEVTVDGTTTKTIGADYLGVIPGTVFPATVAAPKVLRGGTSIATDNTVTYAIANDLGGCAGAVTVDNTNGSSTKGVQSISNVYNASGTYELVVSVNAIEKARIKVTVTKTIGAAPSGGGGGGGSTSGSFSSGGFSTLSATAAVVNTITGIVVASGKTIHAAFSDSYDITGGTSGVTTRAMTGFWRYAPTGTTSWTNMGSAVAGSSARYTWTTGDQVPGSISVNQTAAPAAGTYDIQFLSAANAAMTQGYPIAYDGGGGGSVSVS